MDFVRKTRWFALASLLGLSGTISIGCAVDVDRDPVNGGLEGEEGIEGPEGASTDRITNVAHTPVKRQSIGNCWLYATATWLESLVKSHSGNDLNVSESYWTYWHWFEGVVNEDLEDGGIGTGGGFGVAAEIILRYGVALEKDFIPAEATMEMSGRQASALAAMNESLKNGALKTSAARRNKELVRTELNKAWGLSPEVVAQMDAVFGKSVTRTLDRSTVSVVNKFIMRPAQIAVGKSGSKTLSLKDVLGTKSSTWDLDTRKGTYAWSEISYPSSATARRAFQKRVQKALHDKKPVIISWLVDFNALDGKGTFGAPPSTIGRQGGHMTVLEDYQINNVPGFGTLKAGVDVTDQAALTAALDDKAVIEFFRVKNSWGASRPDREFVPGFGGYHDLYMKYLNGPVKWCSSGEERPCTSSYNATPLGAVVLPPGY